MCGCLDEHFVQSQGSLPTQIRKPSQTASEHCHFSNIYKNVLVLCVHVVKLVDEECIAE